MNFTINYCLTQRVDPIGYDALDRIYWLFDGRHPTNFLICSVLWLIAIDMADP